MAYVDYNSQTALEGAPEGRRRRRRPARADTATAAVT